MFKIRLFIARAASPRRSFSAPSAAPAGVALGSPPATLEDRERRAVMNQTLRRHVNERVVDRRPTQLGDEPMDVLCECFDRDCGETISLTLGEYEVIRESPVRFPVKPGQVMPEVERVVETNDRYEVVEKFGDGGKLAAARDPRSGGD